LHKLGTGRNVGVIRSTVKQDTNGFLLLTFGMNLHDEPFTSFLPDCAGSPNCVLQIILSQLDLILSNADLLELIYSLFRARWLSENAY
jgi:hypothetical protein